MNSWSRLSAQKTSKLIWQKFDQGSIPGGTPALQTIDKRKLQI